MGAVCGRGVRELHACEVFHLFADDADAAFVGGVEFEDAGFNEFGAVEFFCKGKDSGGFACAGRAVEEHVRELCAVLDDVDDAGGGRPYIRTLESSLKDCDGVILGRDVVQVLGTAAIESVPRCRTYKTGRCILFLNPRL